MTRFRSSRLVLVAVCIVILIGGAVVSAQRSANAMATAATAFINGLTPEQRQKAVFPFEGDERYQWNFIPTEGFPRNGLLLREMTEDQRTLAHNLLKTALSQKGYLTASQIMELETTLGEIEGAQRAQAAARGGRGRGGVEGFERHPLKYFFSVFGTPSAAQPWGFRVEGHHISLHFTVVKGTLIASSPSFFGTNPAEVKEGPRAGTRILGEQEDAGRALLMSLNETQRAKAVIQAVALNEIVTTNKLDISPLSPVGIAASEMTAAQREALRKLIEIYTSKMNDEIAKDRMAKLEKAGMEKITFAWAGEAERGKKHYYRIQGPTFLIEHDNSQNDGNHVHSIWRDFQGDFGRDLLREHVAAAH